MIYRRLLKVIAALAMVCFAGVSGYMVIEGWSLFDSLYMTVITIASVGYGETHPLTFGGRFFTIILILCGSATLIYGLSILTAFIVEGELTDILRRRKMIKTISGLAGHFIVCGMSATGRYVIDELKKTGRTFVVIERDPEKIKGLNADGILTVEGDATNDAILQAANIGRAAGLLTTLHADADNLFVVVTARGLNPALKIIAKAMNEESERKLRQVGADRVVMPNFIGGMRMASEMIRPSVVSFLDVMLRSQDATVRVEEINIPAGSPLTWKSLAESGVMDAAGVTLVAVADEQKSYCFNPDRERRLVAGDLLIVMGVVENILKLKARAETA
ncbi:MAG: potassium channel protein [Geobacter sp.]|nr:potassium channel protein [Geobacter sp.]